MGQPKFTEDAPKLAFLPRLEALRGVAAVAVVGYHAYNDEIVTGMAPVVLFFVLSGFVLARSLESNPSPLAFFRNRVFRLLPAAAASVLLLTALHWQFGLYTGFLPSFDPVNVAMNALMLKSDINGPMWSLTVECFAAPLILVCFFAYRRFGWWPLAALCAVLFGLSFDGGYVHLLGGVTNLAPLYAFVVGVLLHFTLMAKRILPHPGYWAMAAIIVLIACGFHKQTAPLILAEVISAGALVYLIAGSEAPRMFGVLDLPPVRFIGRISYSFYLLHLLGLALAERLVPQSAIASFAVAVALTTPMAWLSWRFVETPFLSLRAKAVRAPAREIAASA